MDAIIRIEDLHREFLVGGERVCALRGISFSVESGEFVSIMGTSGSGKSTLLNILGCLDRPTSGSYLIDGTSVSGCTDDELSLLRNRKIGFVFQNYSLLPRTSALDQVKLPMLYNADISSRECAERAEYALERVGLRDRMRHTPSQMSGGQQQRVAIARALSCDPVLLLADEATGNLDTRTSYEIMSLFQELHAVGKSILFVTHEPDISSFTGRTILLTDGLIVRDECIEPRSAREMLESLKVAPSF